MTEEPTSGRLGDLLKQGRLRQRLSIVECAKRTHISSRFLEALEAERWQDLPSESHRLGFLRAYSRFLGVSADEVMVLYQTKKAPEPPTGSETRAQAEARRSNGSSASNPRTHQNKSDRSWAPRSFEQLVGVFIVILIASWGIYHSIGRKDVAELRPSLWSRHSHQSRLVQVKPTVTIQKIHVQAQADSWLRVNDAHHLIFEGVLPSGANREWSGPGPFTLRIANVKATQLFWNDQNVDLLSRARGDVADVVLPLSTLSESATTPSSLNP